jgi:hypothetical protein
LRLTSSIKKAKGIKIIVAFSHLLKPTANENIKPTKKKIKAMPNKTIMLYTSLYQMWVMPWRQNKNNNTHAWFDE